MLSTQIYAYVTQITRRRTLFEERSAFSGDNLLDETIEVGVGETYIFQILTNNTITLVNPSNNLISVKLVKNADVISLDITRVLQWPANLTGLELTNNGTVPVTIRVIQG